MPGTTVRARGCVAATAPELPYYKDPNPTRAIKLNARIAMSTRRVVVGNQERLFDARNNCVEGEFPLRDKRP